MNEDQIIALASRIVSDWINSQSDSRVKEADVRKTAANAFNVARVVADEYRKDVHY